MFDKRLSVHEELYKIFLESNEMVSEAITNSTLNEVERKDLSTVVADKGFDISVELKKLVGLYDCITRKDR